MSLNQKNISGPGLVLPLLFLGVAGHDATALAQSPGTFTAAGFMIAPRAGHTATLLANGQVLLAGGINFGFPSSGQVWLSAELYDPVTGAFHAAANMTTERWLHTATLLPGGKVLIAGGASAAGSALASAELYDPSTGAFTATGNMHQARSRHTATLLNNGEVLIAGGVLSGAIDSSLASAELYDPLTGAFTSTGDMNMARFAHTATLLCDGRVLMDGSHPESDVDGSEVYEPQAGAFDSVITTRYGGAETATLLMDGKVLVTRSVEGTPGAVLYNASTGTFAPVGGMGGTFRNQFTATLLPDRTILMAGGSLSGDALLYDPTIGTFVPSASMDAFRRWHTATLLPDGAVLIAGGYATPPVSLNTAQLYKPVVLTPAPRLYSLSLATGADKAQSYTPGQHKLCFPTTRPLREKRWRSIALAWLTEV